MKKQIDLQLLATLVGGLLFNFLFWSEGLGLNLLLYSIFILLVIFTNKEVAKNRKTFLSAAAHLLAAVLVVYNHSVLSIVAWYISLGVLIGFVYFPSLRSIFTAIAGAFLQAVYGPINAIKRLGNLKLAGYSIKPFFRLFKYIIIPICLVVVFASFYSNANPTFGKYLGLMFNACSNFFKVVFNFLFADISIVRLMHFVLGLLVSAGVIFKFYNEQLEKEELLLAEELTRKKRNLTSHGTKPQNKTVGKSTNNMGLKVEHIIAMVSFAALNVLIFVLNLIDVITLWHPQTTEVQTSNYSAQLHDGTNALITSILVAMAVILYFFRGNLNFYRKNKIILSLCYAWIIQNAFLVASVFLRDYQYIAAHGLTYKRIGVIVFLFLCIFGLFTVYFKLAKRKTLFYLMKTNGLTWYVILLFASIFNWDGIIVDYNISKSKESTIDVDHLISMSDQTLPALDRNRAMLKSMTKDLKKQEYIDELLDQRLEDFHRRIRSTTSLSWNYRDWQTKMYLDVDAPRELPIVGLVVK